jgi:hypothetical protein
MHWIEDAWLPSMQASTPRSSHISALHHQAVRGREVILTENPQLHLVWRYDKIFIKPIPKYLLSFTLWHYLNVQPAGTGEVRRAAIGFMRSYSYLIQHESDFDLAQVKGLIPKADLIIWDAFAMLIANFDKFTDADVSPRYGYGELRLTRLNFYSRIFLRKLTFHHLDAQWGAYLNTFVAPLVTVFAIASIALKCDAGGVIRPKHPKHRTGLDSIYPGLKVVFCDCSCFCWALQHFHAYSCRFHVLS